jgi:hypothetical protein
MALLIFWQGYEPEIVIMYSNDHHIIKVIEILLNEFTSLDKIVFTRISIMNHKT